MIKKYTRERLYSRPDLTERGWTKSMQDRYLPEPDDFRENPHYKCAGVMHLWLRARIHRIEKGKRFQATKARADARRAKLPERQSKPRMTALERRQTEHDAAYAAGDGYYD
ncbi:hypothetical protein [Antarcticimicrobium luteum]|uniref:Uncharacterized protein n=1 Tax=Antarcticimicrobium luteum TaxID=2547397 RepID=A0A4R5VDK5_9RHOB|nr:hypothetical protein [Antarcticimicrobium luteum]TDK50431.1 hypothetical protein E1832_06350 [Antarcticimicrobium luteum]